MIKSSATNEIPLQQLQPEGELGATNGTRTRDLRVTNALLYQLSYCGLTLAKNTAS